MAVAGGGEPGVKLSICRRKLQQVGLAHNVPADVIKTPAEAVEIIAAGKACYVNSIGARAWGEVAQLLRERGLVE